MASDSARMMGLVFIAVPPYAIVASRLTMPTALVSITTSFLPHRCPIKLGRSVFRGK